MSDPLYDEDAHQQRIVVKSGRAGRAPGTGRRGSWHGPGPLVSAPRWTSALDRLSDAQKAAPPPPTSWTRLWLEFLALSESLSEYLAQVTDRVIAEAIHADSSEAAEVRALPG